MHICTNPPAWNVLGYLGVHVCVYVPVEFVSSPSDCANMQMTGYSHLYAGPHTTVGARSFHTKEGDEQAYKQVHTTHTHTHLQSLSTL